MSDSHSSWPCFRTGPASFLIRRLAPLGVSWNRSSGHFQGQEEGEGSFWQGSLQGVRVTKIVRTQDKVTCGVTREVVLNLWVETPLLGLNDIFKGVT